MCVVRVISNVQFVLVRKKQLSKVAFISKVLSYRGLLYPALTVTACLVFKVTNRLYVIHAGGGGTSHGKLHDNLRPRPRNRIPLLLASRGRGSARVLPRWPGDLHAWGRLWHGDLKLQGLDRWLLHPKHTSPALATRAKNLRVFVSVGFLVNAVRLNQRANVRGCDQLLSAEGSEGVPHSMTDVDF